jgi:hypothetical protein
MAQNPLNPQVPGPGTGLPQEPNPLDPSPNVDVLDPDLPPDLDDDDNEMQRRLAPGFGEAAPEPSY